jgi:cytochrome c-type biogenesis protein CcsB
VFLFEGPDHMTSHTYLALALFFYAVGALHVLMQALTRRRLLTSWTVVATLGGFVVHTASLSQRWTEAGHFPAVGLHDGASFLAWATVLGFLVLYVRTREEALGLAIYPAVFTLVLVAYLTPTHEHSNAMVKSLFLPIHATLAFFGYAALFLAFAMSLLYLIQERELKSRTPHAFYYLVPSLERCDTISAVSATVGFAFLTLAIITGALWNHAARGRYWTWDAKEWSAVVAWGIYVGLLVTRYRTGWGGRRAAFAGILGFTAVVLAFLSLAAGTGGR